MIYLQQVNPFLQMSTSAIIRIKWDLCPVHVCSLQKLWQQLFLYYNLCGLLKGP